MPDWKVQVVGVGAHLPGAPVTIEEIDEYLGKIPGAEMSRYYGIIERFAGVRYRHYAVEKGTGRLLEDSAHLGCKAATMALDRAGVRGDELDLIVTTTSTPPYLRAGLAKEIRILLGNAGCATYDLWGACTGIQQAITLGAAAIRSGMFRRALLVGVELPSTTGRAENYAPETMGRYDMLLRAALGDGAGAMVLTGSDGPDAQDDILYTRSGTEGQEASAFHREAGGSTTPLNPQTFAEGRHHWRHDFALMVKRGRPYLVSIVRRALDEAGVRIEDVDHIVPAAANFNYFKTQEYMQDLTPQEREFNLVVQGKIFTNYPNVGNIPSAAVYVGLSDLYETGRLRPGSLLLLPSIEGATWGWGATLLRWRSQKT
jgi:3-oxoacyl-[acyl-carrier-protein] synthase-3